MVGEIRRTGVGEMIKGRSVTKEQKRFHDLLANHVGCIACRKSGIFNTWVSIHHVAGRTRPGAHWMVLPLCASHHQHDSSSGVVAVHPYKAAFEAEYGKQEVLLIACIEHLAANGFHVPEGAYRVAGVNPVDTHAISVQELLNAVTSV